MTLFDVYAKKKKKKEAKKLRIISEECMEAKNKRVAPKTFSLLNPHWPTGQPPATFGYWTHDMRQIQIEMCR